MKPSLKKICICFGFLILINGKTMAQSQRETLDSKKTNTIAATSKWSERMALSIMKRNPKVWQIDNNEKPKWDYKIGFVLTSFESLYKQTKNKNYQNYIKEYVDSFVDPSGAIANYDIKEYNIDLIEPGKLLFDLYKETNDSRYYNALLLLRNQLKEQPRTASGGFWHKQIYPNQMWLDGIYMETPFYIRYTVTFEKGENLDDIAKQFELVQAHFIDPKTGLLYHAWDESKQIAWANPVTGTSPTVWSRAIGWYAMALVDVLDYYPKNHPKYKELVSYLNQLSKKIVKYQDPSGLWFQVTDKVTGTGNFFETSSTCMFSYALAKGVKKGYLPSKYKVNANKAFDAVTKKYIKVDNDGEVHLTQICSNFGLGGKPFRDGSYEFYIKSNNKDDSSAGVGAFILAALELNK
jgi:unsaturated rhamnogalacturonyl hydrolase